MLTSQKKANKNLKKELKKKIKWSERVVEIKRVTKVCKGGKKLSFKAVIIVGNERGKVGIGVGKADDIINAINKGTLNAKKHLIYVEITKNNTISHLTIGNYGAAKTLIKPASEGTGVIAGSSIRTILELAGIKNILSKQLGSNNILNNARATIAALNNLKTPSQVAQNRNINLEMLY
jgi:small subunit ribosomal protein S5